MDMSTQSVSSGAEAYKTQIDALKNDPNATPEFKQQLDAWMQQLDATKGEAAGQPAPGGEPAPAQQLGMTLPPPSASGIGPTAPQPADAPASSDVLSGANVPQALKDLAPAIQSASQATGVPEGRLAAVIWAESRGKSEASTINGGNGMSDSGLMQINSATFGQLQTDHPELQGKSVNDPETNILAGAHLLADMEKQFGSWDLAQRAYNSGPGSVDTSNADITTTGLGDPNYNTKVNGILDLLNKGKALPA